MRTILISVLITSLILGSFSLPAFSQPPRPRPKPPAVRRVPPPREAPLPEREKLGPEFGLSVGYLANILGAKAELRYPNPLELISTDFSFGVMYAQGEDSHKDLRKHALVFADWCYRLTAPWAPGLKSYLGAGVNYDAYTTS